MMSMSFKKLEPIKGLLFDKDGTLFDFHSEWHVPATAAADYVAGGDPVIRDAMLLASGYNPVTSHFASGSLIAAGTAPEILDCWLSVKASSMPREELIQKTDEIFRDGTDPLKAQVTDLSDWFKALKEKGFVIGLSTHDSYEAAESQLSKAGVFELFDFVSGYDSGYGHKPGPGMLQAFCRSTGLQAHQVAAIGDNVHDLGMGRSGGAGATIAVMTGTGTREDLLPLADFIFPSIVEFGDALLQEQKA
jgi:phosphoglycolate phosphatase